MTREQAIKQATRIAKTNKMEMVVVNDPISNGDDYEGPWGYCPNTARRPDGKLFLYPWAEETVIIKP